MSTITETDDKIVSQIEAAGARMKRVHEAAATVIFGQDVVIEQTLITLLAGGHALLIGVPGLAKTLLVDTLGTVLGMDAKRIQFTPDLMPGDVLGTNLFNFQTNEFTLTKGPIFTDLLLADEINRTPPKTQAALLEAMQERKVTIDGDAYQLNARFMVIATQNPIEQQGTYPLPEAQLDRFMFNIIIDYPSLDEEEKILMATTRQEKVEVRKVFSSRAILNIQKLVQSVAVSEYVIKYVARLVRATRPRDSEAPEFIKELVDWGAGPRAGQNLINGGKAIAAMEGRFSVAIEDVKKIAIPVLRHRIGTNFQAQAEGMTNVDIIEKLLKEVPEPKIEKFER